MYASRWFTGFTPCAIVCRPVGAHCPHPVPLPQGEGAAAHIFVLTINQKVQQEFPRPVGE